MEEYILNSKGIVALKDTKNLCYKCLQKKNKVHQICIGGSGYGSAFDNFSTSLQLCDECFSESQKDKPIWDMETVYGQMHFNSYTKKSDYPENKN